MYLDDRIPALVTRLLPRILSFLDDQSDLVTCTLVCRAWRPSSLHALYDNPKFGLRLPPLLSFLRFIALLASPYHLQVSSDVFHSVRTLDLCAIEEDLYSALDPRWLVLVLTHLPNLVSLDLDGRRFLQPHSISLLPQDFRHPALERLNVSRCYNLTAPALVALLRASPRLATLTAQDLPCISSSTIAMLVHVCPALRTLDIAACQKVDDRALFVLSRTRPSFCNLRVAGCHNISSAGIAYLHRCPNLKTLDVSQCSKLSADSIRMLAYSPPPRDRILRPSPSPTTNTTTSHLARSPSTSPIARNSLIALLMHQCCFIRFDSPANFFGLARSFPRLCYLSISFFYIRSWLYDLGIDSLIKSWQSFKCLELMQWYDMIDPLDINKLVSLTLAPPKLKAVQFYRPEGEPDHLLGGYCETDPGSRHRRFIAQSTIQYLRDQARLNGRSICYSLNIQQITD